MDKTSEQMIRELYTVLLGVPGTEDKGLCEDVREIKNQLQQMNGNVRSNTAWRKAICWILGFLVPMIGVIAGIVFSHG